MLDLRGAGAWPYGNAGIVTVSPICMCLEASRDGGDDDDDDDRSGGVLENSQRNKKEKQGKSLLLVGLFFGVDRV